MATVRSMKMLHPRIPSDGDEVCFCSPSLPINPNPKERIGRRQSCIEWANALGLKPVFTPHFAEHTEIYSRASLQMRLDDFNSALDYPFVSIVGGGGGAVSLLSGIDYAKARRRRPVIMGMSDQTKIVNAIAARAGLVTFYGPNGGFGHWYQADHRLRETFARQTVEAIRIAVWEGKSNLAPTGNEEDAEWKPVNLRVEKFNCPHTVEGFTFGGHWNAVAQMMSGTEFFPRPSCGRKLVFIEAIHDLVLPNFIAFERMRVMGYLDDAAILCGGPFWEKEPVREWLISYCKEREIPLVYQLRFGHMHPISVFPVGAWARFDTSTMELTWEGSH